MARAGERTVISGAQIGIGSVTISLILAGCSGSSGPSVVFENVQSTVVPCPQESVGSTECILVRATVVGEGVGTGSCTLYAAGDDENLSAEAESGELTMNPGETVEWVAIGELPDDPAFTGWNPRCTPMIEG